MKKIRKAAKIILNIIAHPAYVKVLFHNIFKISYPGKSDQVHLDATMEWLRRSQDAIKEGGSSGIFNFETGWNPPYPETTGYIIPTFLEYGDIVKDNDFPERAKRMGDWEIGIQLPCGAIRGGVGLNEYPIVFNTGQVIFGWLALYKRTGEIRYLEAAQKAADWLTQIQDEDGKWSRFTYNNIPHAYNVRVAWALMEIAEVTGNATYRSAAEKKVMWVLSNYNTNGWFDHMGFNQEEYPWTHTIAYTLRGLLECSHFLDNDLRTEVFDKVVNVSSQIRRQYYFHKKHSKRKYLAGTFNHSWNTDARYSCLTGNAQTAIIFMKIFNVNKDKAFLDTAFMLIEELKGVQNLTSDNGGIRGGIAGSYPIWGKYVNFGYPNWAAKFFAEALMMKMDITKIMT